MVTWNRVERAGVRTAAMLALAMALAACDTGEPTPPVTSGTTTEGDSAACAHVDVPLLDIPADSDTEPMMRIPLPPGWERNTELDTVDESIRFTLAHTDLGANGRPQNVVVVTLETVPDADAQTIFGDLRAGMAKMLEEKRLSTDVTTTAGTVCGLPAETVAYAATPNDLGAMNVPQARPTTTLHVVMKDGGHTYLVAVSATTEPDKPTYQRDAETILKGFQVLPPRHH